MAGVLLPQTKWSMTRDSDGHREYKITFLVITPDTLDGPAVISQTPGLPLPYSWWIVDNDIDLWAWCKWDQEIVPRVTDEPNFHWDVTLTFTTKPPQGYCRTVEVEDPLLEPIQVSGETIKYTEQVNYDRFGNFIRNSAFEAIRGPQVEFDRHRAGVHIEFNVAALGADLVGPMLNTVNGFDLWGLPPRTIKLSNWRWQRKYWGVCAIYYRWMLDFDIRFDTFDRNIIDEGTQALSGHWGTDGHWHLDNIDKRDGFAGIIVPDPTNPAHFKQYRDRSGNPARLILNGFGTPANAEIGTAGPTFGPGLNHVEFYGESDFTLLGIPLTF